MSVEPRGLDPEREAVLDHRYLLAQEIIHRELMKWTPAAVADAAARAVIAHECARDMLRAGLFG